MKMALPKGKVGCPGDEGGPARWGWGWGVVILFVEEVMGLCSSL
jgi:hypothetical protein